MTAEEVDAERPRYCKALHNIDKLFGFMYNSARSCGKAGAVEWNTIAVRMAALQRGADRQIADAGC